MNCKFCGCEINGEAEFCPECGKYLRDVSIKEEISVENKETKKKKAKKDKLTLILGTVIIIIGVLRLLDSSVSIDSTSFGADFYTYTYNGIVACAELLAKINQTISWGLIAFGSYIDVKAIKEKKQ